ncbi:sugar phosphate isomerase/epimerase family protein [Novosphingobium beihaiensis]|uniref:Sugar phosphate isomerase/epimerase n=1 Tax=Novosphingobium beihaiensis TaxID=2930389 RepID=A0ABT0BRE2_9SPHN|nr:sugar phosphate isomerase/epimerase [Novosphingobium beihaiensis]MCJ2187640.1 sugar phosphate isomerase/epimerase [Novosphingobium beihaiensis]
MNPIARTVPSRRQFLSGAGLACMTAAMPAFAKDTCPFFGRGGHELGLQLFRLSEQVKADLQGSFAHLARLGYRAIETIALNGHSAADLKAAADANGLKIRSSHVPGQFRFTPEDHTLQDNVPQIIDDLHTMGADKVVMAIPMVFDDIPPLGSDFFAKLVARFNAFSETDWQRVAQFLNERGEMFRAAGIRMFYHNHNFEFAPVEKTTGWDILLRETDPELVSFEMDAGWMAAAGLDPIAQLAKAGKRVQMLHIKDIDPGMKPNFAAQQVPAPLGAGVVDWPRLLKLADALGVSGYFADLEPPFPNGPFAAFAETAAYLSAVR